MASNLAMTGEASRASMHSFSAAGPQLFRRDYASSYGWWENLAVVLGRRPPTAEHVANYRACVVELYARYPEGIGIVTVVNDTSTPEPSGRDALVKMFKEIWPMMTAGLFIPKADGFKGAVMRSVMGCFILATGQRDRIRIESTLDAGLPWVTTKLLGPHAREQLPLLQRGISRFCDEESQIVSTAWRA
jgi:hypothetical protein